MSEQRLYTRARDLSLCLARNSAVTFVLVVGSLLSQRLSQRLRPLLLFSCFALSGDLIMGACVTCRPELREFNRVREEKKEEDV